MIEANQFQELTAPAQKVFSDSLSMTLGGLEVSQAQWKKLLQAAFDLGAANARVSAQYAEDFRGRFTEATRTASEFLKQHATLLTDLPADPVGASQKVIAGYVEASRKALEGGAEALKGYVSLVNDLWSGLEQASQSTREIYVEYVSQLQGLLESKAKSN
jgi:hypothetical protein